MRSIPKKLKKEMSSDPYYERCCLRYESPCEGVIEFHHHLQYGKVTDRDGWKVGKKANRGGQVNEKFCILPLCVRHHKKVTDGDEELTLAADRVMCDRATKKQIQKYELTQRCKYANKEKI